MADGFLRMKQVSEMVSLCQSEIYDRVRKGTFPKQRRLSHKVAVWDRSQIEQWMNEQRQSA